ncbi:hypothetical protein AMS62_05960 [Bacillus sp. FJAT-18019]|nr:hypothetical protein AMS62_05960 [Bacillus sp. FJAT-18019]
MKIDGRIERILSDGYERLIYLDFYTKQKKIWVHLIQHEEYLEEGEQSKFLSVGQSVSLEIGINLVNNYSVVNISSTVINKPLQPINESPHVIVVATVMEIKDDDTMICSIEDLGSNILVEFEEKVVVGQGETLLIEGILKAELC